MNNNVIYKKNLSIIIFTFLVLVVVIVLKVLNISNWYGLIVSIIFFVLGLIPSWISHIFENKRDKQIEALQLISKLSVAIHKNSKERNEVNFRRARNGLKPFPSKNSTNALMSEMLEKQPNIVKEVSKLKALYGKKYRDEIKSWDNDLKNMDQEYSNQLSKLKVTEEEKKHYSLMDSSLKPIK
jgi:hypothetical protein